MAGPGLFAYGSLVSPASASHTLGRPVEPSGAVRLPGWRRRWSTMRDNLGCEKTFARRDGGELLGHVLGLNLERADGEASDDAPNGVVLRLSEAELDRLDVRELRYDRVEVTEALDAPAGVERVFAYTAKPGHFAPRPAEDAVVIASYLATLEAAFAELGPGEWKLFQATTGPPPVDVVDAVLVRDRIPAGNPRDW